MALNTKYADTMKQTNKGQQTRAYKLFFVNINHSKILTLIFFTLKQLLGQQFTIAQNYFQKILIIATLLRCF